MTATPDNGAGLRGSGQQPASRFGADVRVWGLTGGIAAGKSTVARLFEETGVPVLDADAVARELSREGGAAHDPIVRRFGTADPAKLRSIVFSDPKSKADLESILHPLILEESERRIRELAAKQLEGGAPAPVLIVYEAALLVETGRYRDFDGLIVVTAPEDVRVGRIMTTRGLDEATARNILRSQMPESEKRKAADVIIENAGSLEQLRAGFAAVLSRLRAPSKR